MKLKIIFPFIAFFLLLSCSENTHFKKFIRLPEDHRWYKMNAKTVEFSIDDDSKLYDIDFDFSHIADYQFNSVSIKIDMKNPSGEETSYKLDLKIKDANGKSLADCGGDICDISMKLIENTKLQKGKYTLKISHDFKGMYLPNVLGIGIKVVSIK